VNPSQSCSFIVTSGWITIFLAVDTLLPENYSFFLQSSIKIVL
jgi:hypothetical protein